MGKTRVKACVINRRQIGWDELGRNDGAGTMGRERMGRERLGGKDGQMGGKDVCIQFCVKDSGYICTHRCVKAFSHTCFSQISLPGGCVQSILIKEMDCEYDRAWSRLATALHEGASFCDQKHQGA